MAASLPLASKGRFKRFLLVGAAGFIVDAGLTRFLVVSLGFTFGIARLPAFLVASVVTYVANHRYTFKLHSVPPMSGWVKYVASTSIGALMNYFISTVVAYSNVFAGDYSVFVAVATGSAVGLAFNYIASTRLVFRQ